MYTFPLRMTTAHPSHILFTEERTFIPRANLGTVARAGMALRAPVRKGTSDGSACQRDNKGLLAVKKCRNMLR